MAQAIKYQDTKVQAIDSASKIAGIVMRYGGTRFEQRWDPETGELVGLRFAIRTDEGDVPVRLAAQTDSVVDILKSHAGPRSRKTDSDYRAQAQRIAWRQLKDFIEQALLAVETGLFNLVSAFMAHVEVWDDEHDETVTVAELMGRRGQLMGDDRGMRLLTRGK